MPESATTPLLLQTGFMKPAPLPVRALFALTGYLFPQALGQFIALRMLRPRRQVRPQRWDTVRAAQLLRVRCGDDSLNAYLWGTHGPLVLLVHGWEGWVSDLDAWVAPLCASGCRVLALELPAHGQSLAQTTDVHGMAEAIGALADYAVSGIGRPHAIIAHSLGAAAVVRYLSSRPAASPRPRLALLAPAGELAAELQRIGWQLGLPTACRTVIRMRLEQRYRQPIEECSTRRLAMALDLPALVVHDRRDRIVPFTEGQALARSLRDARLYVTDGLGHHRLLDDAEVIRQVLAFCAPAAHPVRVAA